MFAGHNVENPPGSIRYEVEEEYDELDLEKFLFAAQVAYLKKLIEQEEE